MVRRITLAILSALPWATGAGCGATDMDRVLAGQSTEIAVLRATVEARSEQAGTGSPPTQGAGQEATAVPSGRPAPVPAIAPVAGGTLPPTERPTMTEISLRTSQTLEASGAHFIPVGEPLTIADGRSGSLTAVLAVRYGTADGIGQLVFFWHNATFLGWNELHPSRLVVAVVSPRPGLFAVSYAQYAPRDPPTFPSLPSKTVSYAWDGSRLVADGVSDPSWDGASGKVRLLP